MSFTEFLEEYLERPLSTHEKEVVDYIETGKPIVWARGNGKTIIRRIYILKKLYDRLGKDSNEAAKETD